jgi:hypothetical protein
MLPNDSHAYTRNAILPINLIVPLMETLCLGAFYVISRELRTYKNVISNHIPRLEVDFGRG